MADWEPQYRYWVAEKQADRGWLCIYKTNWRWMARRVARKRARKGYRTKIEIRPLGGGE